MKYNVDSYLFAADMMTKNGGSFEQAIGKAYIVADGNNSETLIQAFKPLFEMWIIKYTKGVK